MISDTFMMHIVIII